ncbi:DUF2891 domain-containing protein [Aureispira anguillae]|uniref:DUF2891 domain-containing protein n=1 Tax=Aureispira anguillae TaxID=2864201 RepID=A0A915YGS2_9BACT|nr:DUF2891 domain-containing protein [Aureispira anguillae]BDS12868.1 DUF2891 domain-containing protein [Aureispira anguillae]
MKSTAIFLVLCLLISCTRKEESGAQEANLDPTPKDSIAQNVTTPNLQLDLQEANRLAQLPLACILTEFPNKLNQVLASEFDLQTPSELHPAFYGCFDWHSAVHGHWSLVSLLKQFPALDSATFIREQLADRLSKENILAEVRYFEQTHNKNFERTYGWAWLLKLAEELHNWDDSLARELENNLYPLSNLIANKYIEFLPQLVYPIRVGTHTNTGFGLAFAYDYALTVNNKALKESIEKRAKAFFLNDKNGPLAWEPNGYDFLSPCFEEIDIMRRVLSPEEFSTWLKNFLPELSKPNFKLEPGIVSNREDGHLVHLDGLNFSRAWCLYGIAKSLPKEYRHLEKIAQQHIQHSLLAITDGNYEGGHWLASFAIYALTSN